VSVGRSVASVCLSICPCSSRETAWAINSRLGAYILYSSRLTCIDPEVRRSKGQGHMITRTVTVARLLVTRALLAWVCMLIRLPMFSSFWAVTRMNYLSFLSGRIICVKIIWVHLLNHRSTAAVNIRSFTHSLAFSKEHSRADNFTWVMLCATQNSVQCSVARGRPGSHRVTGTSFHSGGGFWSAAVTTLWWSSLGEARTRWPKYCSHMYLTGVFPFCRMPCKLFFSSFSFLILFINAIQPFCGCQRNARKKCYRYCVG